MSDGKSLLEDCMRCYQNAPVVHQPLEDMLKISRSERVEPLAISTRNNMVSKVVNNVKKYYGITNVIRFNSVGSLEGYDEVRNVYPGPINIGQIPSNWLIISYLTNMFEDYKYVFNTKLLETYPNNRIVTVDTSHTLHNNVKTISFIQKISNYNITLKDENIIFGLGLINVCESAVGY
jgi:hypothetical protein